MKHTTGGFSVLMIRVILLRPGNSSPFLSSVMSRVGLLMDIYDAQSVNDIELLFVDSS
jgi:hypothetical protein